MGLRIDAEGENFEVEVFWASGSLECGAENVEGNFERRRRRPTTERTMPLMPGTAAAAAQIYPRSLRPVQFYIHGADQRLSCLATFQLNRCAPQYPHDLKNRGHCKLRTQSKHHLSSCTFTETRACREGSDGNERPGGAARMIEESAFVRIPLALT